MLAGKAKTDYQREYMRRRRSNVFVVLDPSVRPTPLLDLTVRPHETLDPATSGPMLDPALDPSASLDVMAERLRVERVMVDGVRCLRPFTPVPKPGKRMVQSEG